MEAREGACPGGPARGDGHHDVGDDVQPGVALPRRTRPPWLPPLRGLLIDNLAWPYAAGPERGAPVGIARLRVWRAGETGHFAVVTETGAGCSVETAAPRIWQVLHERYGDPFGLAEYWPYDQSPVTGLHADLVLPSPGGLSWGRLWPVERHHPHYALFEAWWSQFGLQVTAG